MGGEIGFPISGPDERDATIERLRQELRAANRRADDAELRAERASEDAQRALSRLRTQLSPLYRALQAVFGELDAAGVEDGPVPSSATGNPANTADTKWQEWKTRLGPSCAKVIDALLLGGEMTISAITISARMGKRTVYEATSKMGRAGILINNGGKFSLK